MPAPWLVLPTYNEAANLEPIVGAVLPQLASVSADHTVLVVDDSSPDGTGEIADRLAAEHEAVQVLHRAGKEGLGRAYIAGFTRAIEGGADLVLEMDADFSHDPTDIPRLIEAAGDADLVLGSRYVGGGGVAGWTWHRPKPSRGRAWDARAIPGVHVPRPTGGLQGFPRRGAAGNAIQGVPTPRVQLHR